MLRDVLAFHNKEGGKFLFFGIDESAYSFCGTPTDLDSKKFNDKLRRYVGDAFWVTYSKEFLSQSGLHLGILLIPKRNFRVHLAHATAAIQNAGYKPYFDAGDLCVRESDETKVFRKERTEQYLKEHNLPGGPNAAREAAAKFEVALKERPNDFLARHALGNMYVKSHVYEKAIEVLEPLLQSGLTKTIIMTVPLLKKCYERTNKIFELADLKSKYPDYFKG